MKKKYFLHKKAYFSEFALITGLLMTTVCSVELKYQHKKYLFIKISTKPMKTS